VTDLASAERVLTRLGLHAGRGSILLQRAEICWAQGEAARCLTAARAAARFFRQREQQIHAWQADLLAARALRALGRDQAAARLARRCLTAQASLPLPWLAQTAHHLLGQVAEARGYLPAAAGHYQAALAA
jgi:hypothetical protein